MKKTSFVLALLISLGQLVYSQIPVLVEDYILGPQGSVDGRIYNFDGILTYFGTTKDGQRAILQYDKSIDEISVAATENEFEGTFRFIFLYGQELLLVTWDGTNIKNVYRSFENDLSDIHEIYDSEEPATRIFRHIDGYTFIIESLKDPLPKTFNVKVVDPEGNLNDVISNLPGSFSDYFYTNIDGHFILAPRVELIDGKSILAYSIDMKSFVPITNVIPAFEECGLLSRIGSNNDNIFYYFCGNDLFLYDLDADKFIDYNYENSFGFLHITEDYFYTVDGNGLYRNNRISGEKELLIDQITVERLSPSSFVCFSKNNDVIDVSYIDFKEEILHTYSTNYSNTVSYRFTTMGVTSMGAHLVIYETQEDNGVLARVNSESYIVIDSLYDVNFNNRPAVSDEEVFFFHQDPEVGNELFRLEYSIISTNDITSSSSINIYPNPTQNFIQVKHPKNMIPTSISIYDINGNLMLKKMNRSEVNIEDLSSGIYLLSANYKNGERQVERFIVN